MRPTLKTIAGIARVSPATVSLCLNRHPVARTLSEETRNRIWAAARECNYRPNYIAKALSRGRTSSIGLVVADLKIVRQANFASEIMTLAAERGNHLLIASTHFSKTKELEAFLSLKERQVDGIIFQFDSLSPDTEVYRQCVREQFPVVKLCRDERLPFVVPDSRRAMEQAVLLLRNSGARRICGIIAPIVLEGHCTAFEEACRKHGVDFELVPPDAGSQSDSYSDGLLARVAGRDDCAFINLGAYNLFRLQRLIRGERRLITFLDEYDPVIELNEPLLAGIIFSHFRRILSTAVEVLLGQIDRPESTPEPEQHHRGGVHHRTGIQKPDRLREEITGTFFLAVLSPTATVQGEENEKKLHFDRAPGRHRNHRHSRLHAASGVEPGAGKRPRNFL